MNDSDWETERDRALAARVRSGDVAAFKEIYLQHYAMLLDLAIGLLRSKDAAEDAVQQVFAELWERRGSWRPYRIAPTLVRSVRHRALDQLRRIRPVDNDAFTTLVAPQTATGPTELDELERMLAHALAQLPERRRVALLLRAVHQMSYAEVGLALDVSEKAAFILVSRARAALEPIRRRFIDTA